MSKLREYKSVVSSVILTTFISLHYSWTFIRCSDGYTKEIENQNRNNNKNKICDIINEIENKHTWAIFEITIEIEKNDFPRLKEDFIKKGLKIFMSQSYHIDNNNLYKGTIDEEGPKAYILKNKKEAENVANSIKENKDEKENENNFKEGKEIPENNEIVKIPFYILVEDISTYNIDANSHNADKTKNHFKTLDNYCGQAGFTYTIKIFAADTSDVTDISFIFSNCKALTKIEGLEKWDTSKVINMSGIFNGCEELTIKIKKWDRNIKQIFSEDYENSLITLDVSKININGREDISNMFSGCKALTEIVGLDKWETDNIKDMSFMFSECSSLKSLPDLSKWHTPNVTDMRYMFDCCSSLSSLPDISKWDTKNVINMSGMFYGCKALASLPDISKWDTSNVTDMSSMFYGCKALKEIKFGDKWDTSKVTNMNGMFYGCETLENIDLSNWDTGSVTDMTFMFRGCKELTEIEGLENWDTKKVKNRYGMFNGCEKIKNNIPDKFK